jgi:ABC-2 type transport system permease protein
MTQQSITSVVGRGDLIRKISIPRWMIVITSSISALISLGLNMIIVLVAMLINRVDVMASIVLLPLILLEVYLFALGASLFLSAAYVKFRDMTYIWEVVLQAGFYLTPILYAMTFIPSEMLRKLQLLNPLAQAIQDARFVTVTHHPDVITTSRVFDHGPYMLIPFGIVLVTLLVGIFYFKKESKYFAENI